MAVSKGNKILASDASSASEANKLVLRDGSKNFSAGTITMEKAIFGSAGYGVALPSSGTAGQAFFQVTEPWYELPAGGTTGQALIKASDDNYDVAWGTVSMGGGGGEGESTSIADLVYPIGSIYMNMTLVDPGELFGGEWTRIQDTFLLAVGTTYAANASGGSAVLPGVPYHRHSIGALSGSAGGNGSHGHSMTNGSAYRTCGDWYSTNSGGGPGVGYSGNSGWYLSSAGNHTHSVSIGSHNTNYEGSQNISILPPYITVYMWKRTA